MENISSWSYPNSIEPIRFVEIQSDYRGFIWTSFASIGPSVWTVTIAPSGYNIELHTKETEQKGR